MNTRELIKAEIDAVDDANIETLHRIIGALTKPAYQSQTTNPPADFNPLKGSLTFEKDILSPINATWDADQ
ncbi:hypothetical protein D5125_01135 [Magnetovirga frankeli]|uniref:hypothetical protein n=1 Tax=Magnetovirga frankeli TaxID=947516 RepID=UPI0012939CAB|nr:hypothetical protein D5125_01135 [gamma proteobacterium SS-5]